MDYKGNRLVITESEGSLENRSYLQESKAIEKKKEGMEERRLRDKV